MSSLPHTLMMLYGLSTGTEPTTPTPIAPGVADVPLLRWDTPKERPKDANWAEMADLEKKSEAWARAQILGFLKTAEDTSILRELLRGMLDDYDEHTRMHGVLERGAPRQAPSYTDHTQRAVTQAIASQRRLGDALGGRMTLTYGG